MIDTATWESLHNLAIRRRVRGHLAEAIVYLEQAIAITRSVPELKEETATMLNYLADTYRNQSLWDQAESTIRDALQLTAGMDPMSHADNLLILAEILHEQKRHTEAIAAGQEGLRLVIQEYGRDDSYTIAVEAMLRKIGITERHGWFAFIVPPPVVALFFRFRRFILGSHQ